MSTLDSSTATAVALPTETETTDVTDYYMLWMYVIVGGVALTFVCLGVIIWRMHKLKQFIVAVLQHPIKSS